MLTWLGSFFTSTLSSARAPSAKSDAAASVQAIRFMSPPSVTLMPVRRRGDERAPASRWSKLRPDDRALPSLRHDRRHLHRAARGGRLRLHRVHPAAAGARAGVADPRV